MNVIDELVSEAAVVLKDVEVLRAGGGGDPLGDGQQLLQRVVRDVRELRAVMLGDDKLQGGTRSVRVESGQEGGDRSQDARPGYDGPHGRNSTG